MRYCSWLFLILASFLHSHGQEFSYTQYNVKDGLAGSVVYCAAEDKDGFLWFGTESGLSRFDGTHFRNFTTANGLPDNEIIKLFVDSRNRIWVVPFRNAICYYLKGVLHNQDNDPVLHQLSIFSEITAIQEDRYGDIVMVEDHAVHVLHPDERIETISKVGGSQVRTPIGGGLTKERLFTFFSYDSLFKLRQYTLDQHGLVYTGRRPFAGMSVNMSLLSPNLNIYQDHDTLYFEPSSGKRFNLIIPHFYNALSKIDDSLFTINTTNGAAMYNLRTRKQAALFLKGQSVNAVMRDSEGSYWFMCAGSGVFRIGSLGFRNISFGDTNHLSVTCIQNIGNVFYVGTERGGLWKSDMAMARISRQSIRWHSSFLGRILAIEPMGRNKLLVGTDGGLILLDHLRKDSLLSYFAVKTITSSKGGLLVGTMQKVEMIAGHDLLHTTMIWLGRSTCSYKEDSMYYIGTFNGLYSIVPGGKARYWGDANPVFKSRVVAISKGEDGTIWVGTSGSGIAGIKDGRLRYSLKENNGLTSNICRTVFTSGTDIWVGTDKGLNRVHPVGANFRITTYGRMDGLSSDIINVLFVRNEDVYVGSASGITHFNTHKAAENSFCKLHVTSFQAAGHSWGYDTSGLVLPHRESAIRVDFVGISYRSAGDITYRYRLNGLNTSWQTTRETFLSYPTLPSGSYELEIVATNKFGVQSEPIRIAFVVQKLLWERGWFIFLAGVLSAGLIWLLVWVRIRQLHRKNAEKIGIRHRMAELEQMSLRAQMNPHFIFNSLNSIQKYVMEKDIRGANKFITDFSRLIRLTLEITSKSKISLDEEVRYISNYLELEKVRFGNTFQYEVAIADGIDRMTYHIPSMLLQPYVENSIRHGLRYREDDKGVVLIRFVENASHLVCTIEDNGVGRRQAQEFKSLSPIEYQSRGMNLTARRMEMMNQGRAAHILIEVEDIETGGQQPAGTRVTLFFPIQYVRTKTP